MIIRQLELLYAQTSWFGCRLTLGTAPAALADVESAAHGPRVRLPGLRIHKPLLRLHHAALALVVHAQHLRPDLKVAAMARRRQRLHKLHLALAIEHALGVELRHAGDGLRAGRLVEVDDLLAGVLKGQDNGVCGEGGEVGV